VQAAEVAVAPGLEFNARPWPGGTPVANDLASVYGFAASARVRGADAIYLFNFMDCETRPVSEVDYRTLVEKGVADSYVCGQARRFPVCYRDTVPAGFPSGVALPVKGRVGAAFRIHIGAAPASGQAHLVFGLAKTEGVAAVTWEVKVNGSPALPDADLPACTGLGGDPARAIRFAVPDNSLQSGFNTVTVKQTSEGPEQTLVWAEIRLAPLRASR
jgi:hypothetical protein